MSSHLSKSEKLSRARANYRTAEYRKIAKRIVEGEVTLLGVINNLDENITPIVDGVFKLEYPDKALDRNSKEWKYCYDCEVKLHCDAPMIGGAIEKYKHEIDNSYEPKVLMGPIFTPKKPN